MKVIHQVYGLFDTLSSKRKAELMVLVLAMLIGSLLETVSIAAIIPVLALFSAGGLENNGGAMLGLTSRLTGSEQPDVLVVVLVFAGIVCISGIVRTSLAWLTYKLAADVGSDLAQQAYLNILQKPYSWHLQRSSAETLALNEKINNIIGAIITPILQASVAFMMAVAVSITMAAINIEIAILTGTLLVLIYYAMGVAAKKKLAGVNSVIDEYLTLRMGKMQDGVGAIRDIILTGKSSIFATQFSKTDQVLRQNQAVSNTLSAAPRFIVEAAGTVILLLVAIIVLGEQGKIDSALPIIGATAYGAQKLIPQIQLLYFSWSQIAVSKSQLGTIYEFIVPDSDSDAEEVACNAMSSRAYYSESSDETLLTLCDVSYRYPNSDREVLEKINLVIKAGQNVAIVGPSGAGKSTLVDLIMGLMAPTRGVVRIANNDLTGRVVTDWMRRINHVPQKPFLLNDTIGANIALNAKGDPVNKERMHEAAKKAQIHEFIMSLPLAYESQVGERGGNLSGGEQQRIGIARAMYARGDVLVLDEPSSALDNNTENAFLSSMLDFARGKTLIMVTHNPELLDKFDLIVEVDGAKVVVVESRAEDKST